MRWCPAFPFSWLPKFPSIISNLQEASAPKKKTFVEAQTSLGALFEGLEGLRLVIPSIEALSPAWKVDVNPHLESIRSEYTSWVNEYVERYFVLAASSDGFNSQMVQR